MNTFLQFINTGKLGEVSLGLPQEHIKSLLGTPKDESLSNKPKILKYDMLQLAFTGGTSLESIHLYFDDDAILPKRLNIKGWFPTGQIKQVEFLKEASIRGVNLTEDKNHCFEGIQVGYRSNVGVIVIFNIEHGNDNLVSVHLTERSSCEGYY